MKDPCTVADSGGGLHGDYVDNNDDDDFDDDNSNDGNDDNAAIVKWKTVSEILCFFLPQQSDDHG